MNNKEQGEKKLKKLLRKGNNMKCLVTHANRRKPSYQVDINTLDELKEFIDKANDPVIISVDGLDDGIDFNIQVYDDYIE